MHESHWGNISLINSSGLYQLDALLISRCICVSNTFLGPSHNSFTIASRNSLGIDEKSSITPFPPNSEMEVRIVSTVSSAAFTLCKRLRSLNLNCDFFVAKDRSFITFRCLKYILYILDNAAVVHFAVIPISSSCLADTG